MNKRIFPLILVVCLLIGAFTAQAQEKRWDGADELPVSPLECGMAGAAAATPDMSATEMAASTEMAPAATAMAYDGGQPTGAPDMAGKPITLVDVPKLIGIGYFAATTKG